MKFVFLTALKTEAKALIKEYNLKKSKNNSFFNNNHFSLFITGMGKEQTLKNISHFLSFYKDLDETIAINIGVAGGNPKTTSLEDCYLINKVKNETNKDVFYPDVLIEHNWEERSLITAKKAIKVPSTNYPNIVDMVRTTRRAETCPVSVMSEWPLCDAWGVGAKKRMRAMQCFAFQASINSVATFGLR